MSTNVTPDSLRKVAGEFEISAGQCVAKGWPALADHEMGVADCLNKAAEILEAANAGVEKPTA